MSAPGGPSFSRREFLVAAAAAGLAACSGDDSGGSASRASTTAARATTTTAPSVPVPPLPGNPFTLGVASGDPLADRVMLWTRLAIDPAAEQPIEPVDAPVQWEVATDERFGTVVARGTAVTGPDLGHAVRVDATGLEPDRGYFYRFHLGDYTSTVGRTRTSPDPRTDNRVLRFGVTSCNAWPGGYYTVYERLANDDDLQFLLFLGDYIYELAAGNVRQHGLPPATTLDEFRRFYAVHRADPQLQAAHAAHPWIVTWDDHEVEDNYAALEPGGIGLGIDPEAAATFAAKRAAAYRAWWEQMPVRAEPPDAQGSMRIYRSFDLGRLARLLVVDDRQYRSSIPQGEGEGNLPRPFGGGPHLEGAFDPDATMFGPEQEAWITEQLTSSPAVWNLFGQQTLMAQCDRAPDDPNKGFSMDSWDGYVAPRNRLLGMVRDEGVENFVSLAGDIHTSAVADLLADYQEPGSPVVGTDLVAPSASSIELLQPPFVEGARANPHVKLYDIEQRGYLHCEVTAGELLASFRYVSTTAEPTATPVDGSRWRVAAGTPGATPL
jgi:alkaline phosphatase D